MTCPACASYASRVEIRTPDQLQSSIALARSAVASGTLNSLKAPTSAYEDNPPIDELGSSGPWPDGLDYRFACKSCGQEFALHAETYHGRGGSWSRVEELPWHGQAPIQASGGRVSWFAVLIVAAVSLLLLLTIFVEAQN